MSRTEKSDAEKRKTLHKIIKDSHSAFMVTHNGEDMNGRPMATAKVEEAFTTLWFASQRNSGKVAQLKADSHVMLGYTNSSGSEWASIAGTARIVDDRAKARELYSPIWNNWFSGPEDPNLVLIEVIPKSAEYWDSGSKAVSILRMAVGAITGKGGDANENEKLRLNA